MKILVTGGSGYLGTFVRQFFAADDFSRRSYLDILDEEAVQKVADYDAVIHLAAHFDKRPEGAPDCFRTNAEGTANVIRHMKPGAVFVYASTKDVYGSHAGETEDGGLTFLTPNGAATRLAATVDADANRTAITLTPSS